MKNDPRSCAGLLVAFGSTRCSGSASGRAPFAPLEKWKKTIFKLKKTIISFVNYRASHVKQPDVASSIRPETKPLVVNAISAIALEA